MWNCNSKNVALKNTFLDKQDLDRASASRGGSWKRGGNFFQGCAIFTKKEN